MPSTDRQTPEHTPTFRAIVAAGADDGPLLAAADATLDQSERVDRNIWQRAARKGMSGGAAQRQDEVRGRAGKKKLGDRVRRRQRGFVVGALQVLNL